MDSPTNPYIAGNPITGTEMFFARQNVFRFKTGYRQFIVDWLSDPQTRVGAVEG
ncbi:MAG: hypothetical protein SXV54_06775 [Chloroflexota bacterium]|nr:hypothetical protein [Chloroflexota bacterium]